MGNKIKVLIVDDSALMRKVLKDILSYDSEIEVVGIARDGVDAIEKARLLKPNVITMDINMPNMDGLTSMKHILNEFQDIQVIVISSLSQNGATTTIEALALGAFDYVGKPSLMLSTNINTVGIEIIEKVKLAKVANKKSLNRRATQKSSLNSVVQPQILRKTNLSTNERLSKIVVIGISTGGPSTLMEVVPSLPENLNAALIIVQHMPATFTPSFAKRLASVCKFNFKEAEDGDILANGRGYLAPGGYHLLANKDNNKITLNGGPKTTLFMPSVNVTMDSILEAYGGKRVVGVIMTGMGDDGANAMVKIRKAGGITIAEDESTAVIFGMPRVTIERGGAEIIAPSNKIADEIVKAINRI